MNNFDYKKMCPFKWFVIQNFPFIEADFDAITNYQLYCKIVEYLNKTIENINQVGEQMENVTNAMTELQNYVNNYFENLDIQEEIDNKLDEMVEQGTLQEIIADYLNSKAIFGYDTVNDMKLATNLINGSYAKTLGYYSKGDGGMATYKIRTITNHDVVDESFIIELQDETLIAELIPDNNVVNFISIGAIPDNTTDNSSVWNKFINSSYMKMFIPQGNYKILDEITLKDGCTIEGSGVYSNIMIQPEGQLILSDIENGHVDIRLRNFVIRVNGERSNDAIMLWGLKTSLLENMIIRSDNGINKYNGVTIAQGNSSFCYDNTIVNCRFNRTCLNLVNSTDNFIIDNIIWANNLNNCGSINIEGNCANNLIKNNHLVGKDYGEIYILPNQSLRQAIIDGNYFDGQAHGIYGNRVENSIIVNNRFWRQTTDAINLQYLILSSVSNNSFNDIGNLSQSNADVVINTIGASSISDNKHIKTDKYTYSTLQPCYSITSPSGSYTQSIVNNCICGVSSDFAQTTATTNVNYFNCFPASKFPS